MKLTKKIRNSIYVEALKVFDEDLGLCSAISEAIINLNYEVPNPYYEIKRYSEIFKHKPLQNYNQNYWFDSSLEGIQKRIDILEQAIKETS